jgi:hypothetical protein
MRAFRALTLILAVAVAACAGGDTTGSTVDVTTTAGGDPTTAPEETTTTSDDGSGVGFDEMPAECVDALVGFLQAIEPALEGIDFSAATAGDLEALGTDLESLGEEYSATLEDLDCPDPGGSDEEAFDAMIEIAEREAPGTVGYLEWIRSFAEAADSAGETSGDCETDIAALEVIIDDKGSMSNLTMEEVVEVGGLMTSISTVCSPERAEEFLSQQKVTDFLGE